MIIWAHFALIKFERQKDAVPELAPLITGVKPSLEWFHACHSFQMALIPLTRRGFSDHGL
jgi:hypothetical protein